MDADAYGVYGKCFSRVENSYCTDSGLCRGTEGRSISDDPEAMDFYCDVIMDEAGKMNRMVKNLLTLNQLEFGD